MSVRQQKAVLREELLRIRRELSDDAYCSKSDRIIQRLKQQDEFRDAGTIHCYISMNKRKEVNTYPLIKDILSAEKKLVVPVTNFDSMSLSHVHLTHLEELHPNKWGVPEPTGREEIAPHELDLVVVPMAGGDLSRNRMGYGKGFYDRFLNRVTCPKIGLVFEDCVVDQIPVESFDIPMDLLITDKRII